VTFIQAGADVDRAPRKDIRPVAMLPEVVDAVIGADTHRVSAYDLTYRAAYGLMYRGCGVSYPS
jgi:hypothetical protein